MALFSASTLPMGAATSGVMNEYWSAFTRTTVI